MHSPAFGGRGISPLLPPPPRPTPVFDQTCGFPGEGPSSKQSSRKKLRLQQLYTIPPVILEPSRSSPHPLTLLTLNEKRERIVKEYLRLEDTGSIKGHRKILERLCKRGQGASVRVRTPMKGPGRQCESQSPVRETHACESKLVND